MQWRNEVPHSLGYLARFGQDRCPEAPVHDIRQLTRPCPREQHHHLSPCKNGSKSRVGDMFRVLANVMFERVILRDFHRVARFG